MKNWMLDLCGLLLIFCFALVTPFVFIGTFLGTWFKHGLPEARFVWRDNVNILLGRKRAE